MLKKLLKKIYLLFKILGSENYYFEICKSQNNNKENLFLLSLINLVKNKYFIEIGFHHLEYNTSGLIQKNFQGQLIDGGSRLNIYFMRLMMFILRKKVNISNVFIYIIINTSIVSQKF